MDQTPGNELLSGALNPPEYTALTEDTPTFFLTLLRNEKRGHGINFTYQESQLNNKNLKKAKIYCKQLHKHKHTQTHIQ